MNILIAVLWAAMARWVAASPTGDRQDTQAVKSTQASENRTRITRISPVLHHDPSWRLTRNSQSPTSFVEKKEKSGNTTSTPTLRRGCPTPSISRTGSARQYRQSGTRYQGEYQGSHPTGFRTSDPSGFASDFGPGADDYDQSYKQEYSVSPGLTSGRRPTLPLEDESNGPPGLIVDAAFENGHPSLTHKYGRPDSILVDDDEDHHDDDVKVGSRLRDGRGPNIVVRGPAFNSVAIGFLVYLILLSVLQNSIFNISRNGLAGPGLGVGIGVGLGPGAGPPRGRRNMPRIERPSAQRRVESASTAGVPTLPLASTSTPPPALHAPVLVAAVLDADPGEPGYPERVVAGPRRLRRRRRGLTFSGLPQGREGRNETPCVH